MSEMIFEPGGDKKYYCFLEQSILYPHSTFQCVYALKVFQGQSFVTLFTLLSEAKLHQVKFRVIQEQRGEV